LSIDEKLLEMSYWRSYQLIDGRLRSGSEKMAASHFWAVSSMEKPAKFPDLSIKIQPMKQFSQEEKYQIGVTLRVFRTIHCDCPCFVLPQLAEYLPDAIVEHFREPLACGTQAFSGIRSSRSAIWIGSEARRARRGATGPVSRDLGGET